jgi:hypothetical protein
MMLVFAIEKIDKDIFDWGSIFVLFSVDETAVDEWVWEIVNWHSVVVKAEGFIDV